LLPLPPDSPDFNPLEQAFAKLKALLRSATARTIPDLWTAIRHAFAAFRPDEGRNSISPPQAMTPIIQPDRDQL
jgi:transposase